MDADPEILVSDMVDLSEVDLNAIPEHLRNVLATSMRRFLDRNDRTTTQYAAFDSVLDE